MSLKWPVEPQLKKLEARLKKEIEEDELILDIVSEYRRLVARNEFLEKMKERIPCKNWKERAELNEGFVEDDLGDDGTIEFGD